MLKFLSLLVLVIGLFTGCKSTTNNSVELPLQTVKTLAVVAPSLVSAKTSEVLVYLPRGYGNEPERIYPLVYFLHGWGSDAAAFQRLGGVETMNAQAEDKQMIIAAISGGTSGYQNWADGETLWEDHLLGEISNSITAKFRVRSQGHAAGVYGVSMGGAAALRLAMHHPDIFSCAAAHSAAISPVEFGALPDWQRKGYLEMEDFGARYGTPFDDDLWRAANPLHLARTLDAEKLKQARYYFDVGVDDQLGFADDNAALSETLTDRGVPHSFTLREGRHGGAFVTANMMSALSFLSECLSETPTSK